MEITAQSQKVEKVYANWDQFYNSKKIQSDLAGWQIGGKLAVISKSFTRGFELGGKLYYEVLLEEGFRILHEWHIGSSLSNAGFDQYVWFKHTDDIIFYKRSWDNSRNNRRLFAQKDLGVCSVYVTPISR